jgi:flavodoxin
MRLDKADEPGEKMVKNSLIVTFALMAAFSLAASGGSSFQQEQQSGAPLGNARAEITGDNAHATGSKNMNPSHTETSGEEQAPLLSKNKTILVAYFSHSGNTREIANQIHKKVGGDIFEIAGVKPYPDDYDECVKQARKELDSGYKPKLKTQIKNLGSYDMVFIGYPNWWGTFPAPVLTFITENDLSGKTIAPFCTHEGSRLGRSVGDIKRLCPKSTVLDGLAVRGTYVKQAQTEVSEWLREIGMMEKK